MRFVHLHVHSHYSLLTAPATVEGLVDRAKEFGMDALALTDSSALYGAVEFYSKAKEVGIKSIIGATVQVCRDLRSKNNTSEDKKRYELVLLAENEEGYQNLMRIISTAHIEGFYYKPRVDKALLRQHHRGLIALSGSVTGEVPTLALQGNEQKALTTAREYEEIFGQGNFYLEVQPHPDYENQVTANEALVRISRATGIPLVATVDVHYVRPEDAEIQDILLCIQNNWKVSDQNRLSMKHLDLSLRSPDEMIAAFKDLPEAIENTAKIADRCDVKLHLGETHLPRFDVPTGFTAMSYLRHLCELGLVKRYGDAAEAKHRERMEYELSVIEKTGFASYFLIVQDFVNWAKDHGIVVGPGRGSAAGSFVAYLTGITNMDPIQYDLLFERFLNPERISMPDVDMDFADDRREDVLNYVRTKYGHDHVAQIITFGTMAARAAVRDTGRALGFPYALCDQISKLIPMFSSIEKALAETPDLKKLYDQSPDAKKILDVAKRLEGLVRHASMHACGVVITDKPVTEYTPIQHVSGSEQEIVTQYASSTKSSAVEKIGLLKMDFLGLKNLTIIQNTFRIVRALGKLDALAEKLGIDRDAPVSTFIDALPLDDALAFKVLQDARTTGVFQLESNGMKRYLKQLQPTVLEDIIAMVALYRPGPMEWIPDFIDGKHGRRTVKYLHPKLEPILKNTYGVAVYQEQVMQIARDLAGFTLGEADVLRKAMGKKILALIKEQRIKFVDGCVKNGIDRAVGEKVFTFIEPFAGYGFNRSHAACYALIGYQTAYLKGHYPAEFMAALLTSDQDSTDRISIEVSECREMGIEVLPPSVNESFEEFAVIVGEDGVERVRFGLSAIKNLGHHAAAEIVAERKRGGPYRNLSDFIERVGGNRDLNRKSIEALAKVGAFDAFAERNQILHGADRILQHAKNIHQAKASHQTSLFGTLPLETSELRLPHAASAGKRERLQWEKELLGLYVSDHPVSDFQEYFNETATPIHELEKHAEGDQVAVGGVIAAAKKIYTKGNEPMFFVTLEDLTGRTEVLVFPRTAKETEALWQPDTLVLVRGKVSRRDGAPKIAAERVEPVTLESIETFRRARVTQEKFSPAPQPEAPAGAGRLVLELGRRADQNLLKMISDTVATLPKGPVKLMVRLDGHLIETAFSLEDNGGVRSALQGIPGVTQVSAVTV